MKRTTISERALVLAPHGRDAAIAAALLSEAGLEAATCSSLSDLLVQLDRGAAFVVVTEEAISTADLHPLSAWIEDQEEWSDLPFVLLTNRGGGLERNPSARRHLDILGNVTFLERPFHPTTFVSLARSALRGRRRQYEARARLIALRESGERYRTLFEAIDSGFCIIEVLFEAERPIDYRFVEVNPAFQALTGLIDAGGKRMRDLMPTHEGSWLQIFSETATTGVPVRFEDGAAALGRWYEVHAFRVGDPEERRVAVLFNDISERRRAEQALRELNETLERRVAERTGKLSESQSRFQGIFDSALQFMALLTPGGTVVEVNRTALTWSQIQPSEIIGRPFWLAAPMRDNPALQASVRSGIERAAAGATIREEHEMRGPGEVRATVDFSLKPVLDAQGEPIFLVAEGRDVTELKETQQALRQSQKMEAMGQLTGGVAHDFNNLLTPIIGSLDMLTRRGVGSERERRLIGGALQAAERARTLVQRLLAFARRQPLQPTAVDVSRLVDGMLELIGSTLGPTIDMRIELDAALPPVRADANQLEMALLNLAVNARDAMPDGGRLTIAAQAEFVGQGHRSDLAQGHYVRLCVGDTGTGMDRRTLERAVEPFFSTKGVGQGTGLGLSMVHGLLAQLGGGLTMESALGEGTRIELWLPISAGSVDRVETSEAPLVSRTLGTALLVDDEDLVRMSTADMLMDLGYEVFEAGSAEQALGLIDMGLNPDLLVTDHVMPGMSGAQLARELKAARPQLSVLIVSGYAEENGIDPDVVRLAKPFRKAELVESLSRLSAGEGLNP